MNLCIKGNILIVTDEEIVLSLCLAQKGPAMFEREAQTESPELNTLTFWLYLKCRSGPNFAVISSINGFKSFYTLMKMRANSIYTSLYQTLP